MSLAQEQKEIKNPETPHTYGGINLLEEVQIDLINGLPGFEQYKSFILAELEDYAPFYAFKSVEEPEISMLVMQADGLDVYSNIHIAQIETDAIGLGDVDDIKIFVVLKMDKKSNSFTANVKAPLVINFVKQTGKQIILENSDMSVEYPLFSTSRE